MANRLHRRLLALTARAALVVPLAGLAPAAG
jgi:hypothetical protein